MINEKRIHANIDISTSGDNTIISAPAGTSEFLVIDHINLVPNSAVSIILKTGSTSLSGTYSLTANQGFVLENSYQDQDGLLTCGKNEAFIINLSGAVQVSGFVKYRIINR
jgi:hypothetical protein